jgi:hypothetical protein
MQEGLVVIGNASSDAVKKGGPGVSTLLDGNPENNFLTRALAYNPAHFLDGAKHMALHGHYAYICCKLGIAVVNLDDPLHPKIETVLRSGLKNPRKIAFQFRYAFIIDDDGLKVLDVTNPTLPTLVKDALLPITDARDIYICRTFGYVAAGKDGLIIVDLENPEALRPEKDGKLHEIDFDPDQFRADKGKKPTDRLRHAIKVASRANLNLSDTTAVRVGMTNNSLYAYVADGIHGLKVLQLTSDETPGFNGFSPLPVPRLIAHYATRGPAISLSKGLDRDRAVDESGHQLSVFGRLGARPFNLFEQRRMFLIHPDRIDSGVWRVSDDPEDADFAVDVGGK